MEQVRSISHSMGPYNQISTYNEVHNLYNIVWYERKSNPLIQNHIVSYCTILYNTLQYPHTPIHTTLYQYALHMLLYHALRSIIFRCIIWNIASESHAIQYDIAPLDTIQYHIIHNNILIIIRWNTTQLNMIHVTLSFYTLQCIIIEIEFIFKSRKFKKEEG